MKQVNSQKLHDYINIINNEMLSYNKLNLTNNLQKNIINAMNYSLSAGGKRIRPVLLLEFCRICGGDIKNALPAASAIEMIHTFSLIHDDLPCMDNDDLRRGIPSCHKAYGEAIALLAGDALENLAFNIISNSALNPPEIIVKLIQELSYAVGIDGMIGGQVIDMENEGKFIDAITLNKMYAGKTGALLRAACRMGCITAKSNETQLADATVYAEKLGLAFQIIDDILDVNGNQEVLGKPIGSDKRQGKTTFVTLYGIEEATKRAEDLTNDALKILSGFSQNDFLTDLTKNLAIRKK